MSRWRIPIPGNLPTPIRGGFLAQFPDGAVLDEVQRCPQLLSYLQGIVDARSAMGLFILPGSQPLGVLAGVTQSLAGRGGHLGLAAALF